MNNVSLDSLGKETLSMSITPEQNRNVPPQAKPVRLGLIKAVPVVWDLEANWGTFQSLAEQAVDRGAQLICTPEGFLDGYPMDHDKEHVSKERIREVSQSLDGDNYLRRVRDFARKHRAYVIFAFTELAKDGSYNSAVLIDRDGELLGCYHKTHLLCGEDKCFLPGKEIPVWQTDLGKIGIMICMDRYFPEVSRTLRLRGADLIMVPSYGGFSLYNEWRMRIRAGDDECFMCFVHPKVGLVVNPQGDIVGKLDTEEPGVLVEEVNLSDTTRIKIAHRRPELYGLFE